ncbi:MAG: winged helix-turn-helix transcriptional regulator [Sulfolobales archaeon]
MLGEDFFERSISLYLDDIDRKIIEVLDVRGGSIFQSELQDILRIPKTTLWRHVKRLERLGIVRVEKIGIQNKITLIKKPKI